MNDMTIIYFYLVVFLGSGFLIGLAEVEFNFNHDDTINQDDLSTIADDQTALGIVNGLINALAMFIWTFGTLPIWMDTILTIFRIHFWMVVARNIWIGGGG